MTLAHGNTADQLVASLTLGPIPEGLDWEVVESGYDDNDRAWARLRVGGAVYLVSIEPELVPA